MTKPSIPTVATRGRHWVVELHGCRSTILDDQDAVADLLKRAAEAAGATVLDVHVHGFDPVGVAGVAVLAESHLSIHTWPEVGYVAADLYTCGRCDPSRAYAVLVSELAATRSEVMELTRGVPGGARSLALVRLTTETHEQPRIVGRPTLVSDRKG
ncbi:adenosylmethionine decarboxylase [Paraliomyxa miuraensis]|uniref:adenosylmethionine decarboxylase n=1 Tax=Paraliomyxa miuraensis TaxID=376150 RepID=UPI00225AB87D|nr:adenosylmethionine decarboxylase [Paraliomyxa miuraensis]MCX4239882.1 adenosylmethionine decarboxylase [Paraliomyxa miuraensis]